MRFLSNIFKRKPKYSDEELLEMGEVLINKILIINMNQPYNKIVISKISKIKNINNKRYVEFIGYNLNRQLLSLIVSINTYIKFCKSSNMFEAAPSDEIFLKEIQELNENED